MNVRFIDALKVEGFGRTAALVVLCAVVFGVAREITVRVERSNPVSATGSVPAAKAPLPVGVADTTEQLMAAVLVGSRCTFSRSESTLGVLRQLRQGLGKTATSSQLKLEILAIDIDASPMEGSPLLRSLGDHVFDQSVLGGGWNNELVSRWVWNEGYAAPMLPQIIVFRRKRVHTDEPYETRTIADQHLLSVRGVRELEKWSRLGFPVPAPTSP
ncbi:hypothetical protein [Gemmatimonas sp.]|uniref:hypothetical protein n=1 Tax=Gemmatimonas sp. TaxID=1962908 RepID=UPI0025BA8994|nr:hypothetical protein [Gemmatimonas sp.]MCA2993231.1 hypothetical protein [Gemmatimonas sp.]